MADLTTQILIEIRDEIRSTNQRLDATNGRLDSTNERLDSTNHRLERLERRQVETEIRISTQLTEVAGAIRELTDVIVEDRELRNTVADHERRLVALEHPSP
jgi:chromosome segregation ATPase